MRKRTRPHSHLKDVQSQFSDILGESHYRSLSLLARAYRNWASIVGSMLAEHSEPVFIEFAGDGSYKLIIAVNHPSMAYQVRCLHDQILTACQGAGMKRLTGVATRVQAKAGMAPKTVQRKKLQALPLSTRKKLARQLPATDNHQLRLAIFKAHVAQLQYQGEQTS